MAKNLVRWTMGNVHPMGFKLLHLAVNSFIDLYQDYFDYAIVYNSLDDEQIASIKTIGVPLIEATYNDEIKYPPQDSKWKLYPPRLRCDVHEIILDNDIIWFNKIDHIDEFVNTNKFLVCDGKYRRFGHYDKKVPTGVKLNSGIVGYPPGFDLGRAINKITETENHHFWQHWNDDQGILAAILLNEMNYIQIPLNIVSISYPEYIPSKFATHFCGINKGHVKAYNQYSNIGSLMI